MLTSAKSCRVVVLTSSCLSATLFFFNIWLMNLGNCQNGSAEYFGVLHAGGTLSATVKTLYSFMDRADNNSGSQGSEGKIVVLLQRWLIRQKCLRVMKGNNNSLQ